MLRILALDFYRCPGTCPRQSQPLMLKVIIKRENQMFLSIVSNVWLIGGDGWESLTK